MQRLIWLYAGCIYYNIGIKHGFSCINICQVPWEVLKTEAGVRSFQYLPRNLANVNALKNHVRLLLLHKNWKHLLYFALFLALLCFTFSLMSHNTISMNYACSRARQYTSRNDSKSVAQVRLYWKLRSCINSVWIALLIHGFSPVNARLLITCDTAFYAIMWNSIPRCSYLVYEYKNMQQVWSCLLACCWHYLNIYY